MFFDSVPPARHLDDCARSAPPSRGSARPSARGAPVSARPGQSGTITPPISGVRLIAPWRVLIVDDDPMLLKAMTRALRGYDIVAVETLSEAERILGEDDFDVVITDLHLGARAGTELVHWIDKRAQARPGIIVSTGATLALEEETALEKAGHRVLHKPVSLEAFKAAIDAAAERNHSAA